MRYTCAPGWHWDFDNCNCAPGELCPVVVDTAGNGFDLTDGPQGTRFDLDRNRHAERLPWTAADSDDAWLALDRNGNGRVDDGGELFGNYTDQPQVEQPNGFLALAEFDKSQNGGNGDGVVNAGDRVFNALRLWQDANHNGVSEANELHTLQGLGVTGFDLKYKESKRTDESGNNFRYRAKVFSNSGVEKWAWDVFLSSSQ